MKKAPLAQCHILRMASFLTTHAASAQIEGLITGARERLVLVSPFLHLSTALR